MPNLIPLIFGSQDFISRLLSVQRANNQYASQIVSSSVSLQNADAVFADGRYKSTTISLGLDPRIGTKPTLTPPAIVNAQISADAEGNPMVTLDFQISNQTLQGCNIVAFNIYRREVPAQNLAATVDNFNSADFDRIGLRVTKKGKFSQERKAQYSVNPALQPQVSQNANLYSLQQTSNAQQLGQIANNREGTFPDYFQPPTFPSTLQYTQIGQVNYQNFVKLQQNEEVYVQGNTTTSLSYTDSNVSYGTAYDYTVTSFCSTNEESSNAVDLTVTVLNLNGINRPISFIVKQIVETSVQLNATFDANDSIKNVYIFRRQSDDVVFRPLGVFPNANNTFTASDENIEYLQTYTYRMILENVWGVLSEPAEVTVTCSAQKVIEKTRSFNLAIPIILAAQDQNSNGILVTIFPNDPKVLYYDLTRKNLTTGERIFAVPGNTVSAIEYWSSNQFFVSASLTQQQLSSSTTLAQNSLPSQAQFSQFAAPISFVDNIVVPGNLYQYRTVGYDIYGNKTSYAFSSCAAAAKNSLRSPINLKYETLRQTPFRLKLSWQDDNEAAVAASQTAIDQQFLAMNLQNYNLNQQQAAFVENLLATTDPATIDIGTVLAGFNLQTSQISALQGAIQNLVSQNNPIKYIVQRRMMGQQNYDSFPGTLNTFIIDEVSTLDFIPFSTGVIPDTFTTQSSIAISASFLSRSFGLPNFLTDEQTYQYRVLAQTLQGDTSNYTDPLSILVQSEVSPPINLSASALNARVTPLVIQVAWNVDPLQARPDSWRIERQVNIPTDTFKVIGNTYLSPEYFDRSAQTGNNYIYRVRGVTALGQETTTAQVNIQV